jgi:DNA-directed RNA polymerase specialized sigma24 family protein
VCDSDTDVRVKDIYDAIDSIPGDTGRVMRLLIEGHKYVEISLMTRLPLGTVKTHIRLSREILKRVLSDNEK